MSAPPDPRSGHRARHHRREDRGSSIPEIDYDSEESTSESERRYPGYRPDVRRRMYGPSSIFVTAEWQASRSQIPVSNGFHHRRERPASSSMPFSIPIRTSSSNRYWGGEENPELTTSYIDYATDLGPYGDLETLVDRQASLRAPTRPTYQPQQYARYEPDARYAIRSTRRERDADSELNDDIRSFDQDVDMSTSAQRSDYSRQRSGSGYNGTPSSRQSRRDSQADVYINGNVQYQFARSQNGYRCHSREDDRR